ncbi:MAG: hypothetical protein GY811_01235 [Myxococcales bacterium]|nr:hypothetical protein [Myxococcales bacterium]
MIPVFRERTYDITRIDQAGKQQRLARHTGRQNSRSFSTEHDFASSPTGEHLVYARGEGIVVRKPDGEERFIEGVRNGKFRFSSDGKKLAYAIDDFDEGKSALKVLDLGSERVSKLGVTPIIHRLKWTRDGILVEYNTYAARVRFQHLDHLSLSGEHTTVYLNRVLSYEGKTWQRFVAHDEDDRVFLFHGGKIIEMHREEERWQERVVGSYRGYVTNTELSSRGDLAFVTEKTAYLLKRDDKLRKLPRSRKVHSLWFSRDGQKISYANKRQVTRRDLESGKSERWSSGGKKLTSIRFLGEERGLIITAGQKVFTWAPAQERPALVASVSLHDLGGADLFADDIIVWTSHLGPKPSPEEMRLD